MIQIMRNNEEKQLADKDKNAVKKVFIVLADIIKRMNYGVQFRLL